MRRTINDDRDWKPCCKIIQKNKKRNQKDKYEPSTI